MGFLLLPELSLLNRFAFAATRFRYRWTIFSPQAPAIRLAVASRQHLSFHGPFVRLRIGRRCHPASVSSSGRGRLLRLIEFAGGRLADGCDDGCCQLIALTVGEKLHQYRSY